jgi:hypothetical protein
MNDSAEGDLAQLIGLTCERALALAQIGCSRRCGPFEIALRFKSSALANAIEPVFPTACHRNHDLTMAFLSRQDLDLSGLIPELPDVHRALAATNDYYAAWWPGQQPVLYLLDKPARRGLVWFAADEAPNWELSRPALPLIQALSADTAWTPAHGGAVGKDGRFLLLAGEGRSGKTTAALACAQAGWDYAGDDYVIADTKCGRVEPLYTSARLRIDVAAAFAALVDVASSRITEDDGDIRHELRLAGLLPHRIRGGTLAAILLPRRQGSPFPTFAPASRLDALKGLIKPTVLSLPGCRAVLSVKLAELVGCAPTFFVDTGRDPMLLPPAFECLLNRLPS